MDAFSDRQGDVRVLFDSALVRPDDTPDGVRIPSSSFEPSWSSPGVPKELLNGLPDSISGFSSDLGVTLGKPRAMLKNFKKLTS